MKKLSLLLVMLLFSVTSFTQYFQNFDNLSYGDYIGLSDTNWTTWSNNPGSVEDARVDTVQSFSPNNSIYFMSTSANGGPQDAVLEFGNEYNTGLFEFEIALFITPGKGAYMNLQAETTIGNTWALDFNFIQDSTMYLNDQNYLYVMSQYPVGQWFRLQFNIDLNANIWKVYLDSVLIGTFQNAANQIASLDIFPLCQSSFGGNGQSEFWVDDIGFTHTPYNLPPENAALYNLGWKQATISGLDNVPVVEIRNLGTATITDFDVVVDYNGMQLTKSVTGVTIPSLATYAFEVDPGFTINASATTIAASVVAVNGTPGDDDNSDDSKSINFNPVVPAPGKMVIVEEATGTWCGWCPRGAVAMEFLARDYQGLAQGIAVHNNDPMAVDPYDKGLNTIISGYPSATVNREADIDPSAIFAPVNQRITEPPTAWLSNGASYDAATDSLHVSLKTKFDAAANSSWKVACVLIEDGVTGTASGYGQANYYSGGSNGDLVMPDGTNWANLPSTVPANQMVFNDVARAISPGFTGYGAAFPATVNPNDSFVFNFSFAVEPGWDTANMHIVGMLIKPNGDIDNGSSSSLTEAIDNGFEPGLQIVGVERIAGPDFKMEIFPNPAVRNETVALNFYTTDKKAEVIIRDINGKVISINTYTTAKGNNQLLLETNRMVPGTYLVQVITENKSETHRLIVVGR